MAVINNYAIAPDGTQTAILAYPTGSTGRHELYKKETLSNGSLTYTVSFYAKQISDLRYLRVPVANGGSANIGYVDLQEGIAVWDGTNSGSASITDAGNGWWRISFTYVPDSTNTGARNNQLYISPGNTSPLGVAVYTNVPGDVFRGILVWGFQMEQGSFPTSYIKTTSSQVTRSADDAEILNIDTSEWFNNQEGTLYTNLNVNTLSNTNVGGVSLGDNNNLSGNRIELRAVGTNTTIPRFDMTTNGVNQMIIQTPNLGTETNRRLSLSYSMNDFNVSTTANGNSVNADTSGNIPILNKLVIGKAIYNNLEQLGGTIKKVSYYPKALTDNEITDLTEE